MKLTALEPVWGNGCFSSTPVSLVTPVLGFPLPFSQNLYLLLLFLMRVYVNLINVYDHKPVGLDDIVAVL